MAKRRKIEKLPVIQNKVENGFADAIGFGSGGNFGGGGQLGFPGGPTYQQVSSTTTLYTNLRWYLISNMRQVLSQLYAEIGLVKTLVCVPVDDALRGGILIKSRQLDEDQIKQLQLRNDRDDELNTSGWAAKWNRLFGGAGELIMVGDQDPETPLDLKAINEDTEVIFRAVDMWELFWDKQSDEGWDPGYVDQDFEFYNYYGEQIHKSRVIRYKGIEAPSFIRPRLRGWGVSVVEDLVRSLNQYLKAVDLSFEVLDEFKIDVYKIKNLVNTLLSPNGSTKVKERIQASNWQKNYQNAIVMDAEDDYAQKQLAFSGLADAQREIRMQVAADLRMPITKLFGTSVAGGFQTDQNDMENYNCMVEGDIRGKLKYPILQKCEIKCQQLFGFIPDDLEIEFKPLREVNAVDQETIKTQKFTRLMQAKQAGEITTLEFRDASNKGKLFDVELDTQESDLNSDSSDLSDTAEEEPKDDKPQADQVDTRTITIKKEKMK